MPSGGSRPGAGRPRKDAPPKTKIQAAGRALEQAVLQPEKLATKFKDAEEFLMSVVNSPDAPLSEKVKAASVMIPYQKPRLEPVGQGKKEQQQKAAQEAATGRFAAPAPPKLVVSN